MMTPIEMLDALTTQPGNEEKTIVELTTRELKFIMKMIHFYESALAGVDNTELEDLRATMRNQTSYYNKSPALCGIYPNGDHTSVNAVLSKSVWVNPGKQ